MADDPNKTNIDLNEIKKYVRTYQSDISAVQSGSHPDLAPLEISQEKQSAPLATNLPTPKTTPPVKAEPAPKPKPVEITIRTKPAAPPPPPEPVFQESPPQKISEPNAVSKIFNGIRTYMQDFARAKERPLPPPVAATPPPLPPKQAEVPPQVKVPHIESVRMGDATESRDEILERLQAKVFTEKNTAPPAMQVLRAVTPNEGEESRDEILTRLRAKAEANKMETPAPVQVAPPEPVPASKEVENILAHLQPRNFEKTVEENQAPILPPSPPPPAPRPPALPDLLRPTEHLIEGSVLPPERPVSPPPSFKPLPTPFQEGEPAPFHTFTSDFRDRVKDTRASTATLLAAEQDAGEQFEEPVVSRRSRIINIAYIVGSVVLLIGAGTSGYVAYQHYVTHPATVAPAPTIATPIFVDDREQISGVGSTLISAIVSSVARPLQGNGVRFLYMGTGTSTADAIFPALQLPAPAILLRNLVATGSMAGVINTANGQSPFFILSVSSYGDTFSGMLAWEPRMINDLGAFFPAYPVEIVPPPVTPISTATTSTATSTTKTGKAATTTPVIAPVPATPIVILGFRDELIDNHDVRVYRDLGGRSVLLYGYWNASTLVIARDEAAFTEILTRLGSSRTQ